MNTETKRMTKADAGEIIKRLRQQKQLSLQEFATQAKISVVLLSQIESQTISVPIAVLLKLARALSVPVSSFFVDSEDPTETFVVTPRDKRATVYRSALGATYSYQRLAPGMARKSMEPFYVRFEPSNLIKDFAYQHDGEEFLYLLSGSIEYVIQGQAIILKHGDSIYLDSTVPHSIRCLSEEAAEALVVVFSPPLPKPKGPS